MRGLCSCVCVYHGIERALIQLLQEVCRLLVLHSAIVLVADFLRVVRLQELAEMRLPLAFDSQDAEANCPEGDEIGHLVVFQGSAPCALQEISKLLPLCGVKSPESLDIVHLDLVHSKNFVLLATVVDTWHVEGVDVEGPLRVLFGLRKQKRVIVGRRIVDVINTHNDTKKKKKMIITSFIQ